MHCQVEQVAVIQQISYIPSYYSKYSQLSYQIVVSRCVGVVIQGYFLMMIFTSVIRWLNKNASLKLGLFSLFIFFGEMLGYKFGLFSFFMNPTIITQTYDHSICSRYALGSTNIIRMILTMAILTQIQMNTWKCLPSTRQPSRGAILDQFCQCRVSSHVAQSITQHRQAYS